APHGPPLDAGTLAARVERQLPDARVTLIPLGHEAGEAALLRVEPRAGTLSYDQVFADPATGRLLGTRLSGEARLARANVMPFLYLLHYSLQLPGVWGVLLMGAVACLWAIDSFIGFALTLPRARPLFEKWKAAWTVKRGAGTFRLNFDLHRAGGL